MAQKIVILGSTGSIGRQTLQVVDSYPGKFEIVGLSCRNNIDLIEIQIRKYKPALVSIPDGKKALELRNRIRGEKTVILSGENSLVELSTYPDADLIVVALVGFSGLLPTLAALRKGKRIALANKEVLVAGGEIVIREAKTYKTSIVPIDSEHSAIFQCLQAGNANEVNKIILTASGGPFRLWNKEDLANVKPVQALKHPNWNMGAKITIDSATLMNKGFEVLEAHWLFGLELEKIEVVVHPESIVHSMVEFIDGSIIAQMGVPSMHLPIQYALSYPERWKSSVPNFDITNCFHLNFYPPDLDKFPCLSLAYLAGKIGGTMPAVLNAANEIAVEKFLKEEISFLHISALLEDIMNKHKVILNPTLEDIINVDRWAREESRIVLQNY
ncbi:MAG: 1-deoxy-D-xylulose-5-phosphate reductoisomerase [Dethiobacteria bacterium]|jgi:1-deoxy-D-xylulose-5-phosphate reductoisomerase